MLTIFQLNSSAQNQEDLNHLHRSTSTTAADSLDPFSFSFSSADTPVTMNDTGKSPRSHTHVPNDTGHETNGRRKSRISGSGHFGVQAMESKRGLSSIMEDKSKQFNDLTTGTSNQGFSSGRREDLFAEESDRTRVPFKGDDKPRCDANKSFRAAGPFSKAGGSCMGKHVILGDLASISTMGNSNLQHPAEKEASNKKKQAGDKNVSYQDDELQKQPWVIQQTPNEPHPLLEFPPLYWLVKSSPGMLDAIKYLYSYRWRMSYPLQRRVFLSKQLAKAGIFCTYGELLLVLPMIGLFLGCILTSFVWPDAKLSGHFARIPLIFALATAMRNSLITLLIGLPFERALWYHKVFGRMAFFGGLTHTIVCHADAFEQTFHEFLVYDTINSSGTGLFLLIAGVTITSLPQVRHWCFEVFYYVHICFVLLVSTK